MAQDCRAEEERDLIKTSSGRHCHPSPALRHAGAAAAHREVSANQEEAPSWTELCRMAELLLAHLLLLCGSALPPGSTGQESEEES